HRLVRRQVDAAARGGDGQRVAAARDRDARAGRELVRAGPAIERGRLDVRGRAGVGRVELGDAAEDRVPRHFARGDAEVRHAEVAGIDFVRGQREERVAVVRGGERLDGARDRRVHLDGEALQRPVRELLIRNDKRERGGGCRGRLQLARVGGRPAEAGRYTCQPRGDFA